MPKIRSTFVKIDLPQIPSPGRVYDYIFPIPGTKRIKYLEENVGSLNVLLSREELMEIDAIAPRGIAAGSRYPESMMGAVNR